MSDFTAIGQLVNEARNLLDSIKGGAIRTMQTQFDALIQTLTARFNGKLTDYQNQVSAITKPSVAVIKAAMSQRLYLDPNHGNDANSGLGINDAFKTLQALINSTPDGAYISVQIIRTSESAPLVLDTKTYIDNRHIFFSAHKADTDDAYQFITLATPIVFESKSGSISVWDTLFTFNVVGSVTLMASVRGKSTLNIGGYGGNKFRLTAGSSLAFITQHYDFPSGISEVTLNRVRCQNHDGTEATGPVTLISSLSGNIATTAIFNIWQSSFGTAFTEGGAVNNLASGVKLISKRG